MKEEIVKLYADIDKGDKIKMCRKVAEHCGRGVNTVKNHWFGAQDFPEKFQKDILKILKDN